MDGSGGSLFGTRQGLCLVVALMLACVFGVSGADAAEPNECQVVHALERLPQGDREFLEDLCLMDEARARLWARAEVAEYRRLKKLTRQLVSSSRAEAATLLALLPYSLLKETSADLDCDPQDLRDDLRKALLDVAGEERKGDPKSRVVEKFSVDVACKVEFPRAGASHGVAGDSTIGVLRPVTILAPPEQSVFVLVGGRRGYLLRVKPATVRNGEFEGAPYVPYVFRAPYGVPYVALIQPQGTPSFRNFDPDAEPAEIPFVSSGTIGKDRQQTILGVPQRGTCIDLRVAADEELDFYLDGLPLRLEASEGVYSETVWIPSSAESSDNWSHRLVAIGSSQGKQTVRVSRDISFDADARRACTPAYFDLTTRTQSNLIGLIQADAGDCADAGIDVPKLHSFVDEYVREAKLELRDIRAWSQATRILSQLEEESQQLQEHANRGVPARRGFGASRGRLDTSTTVALGGAELLRQGFSRVLDVRLRCSRRADAGWDYSFVARRIAVLQLSERERDGLRGVELNEIQETEIELILERKELSNQIRATLARLLETPAIGLEALPARAYFAGMLQAEARVFARDGHHYADLGVRELNQVEAAKYCTSTEYAHELRAKSIGAELSALNGWVTGAPVEVESGKPSVIPLSVEQKHPKVLLVRARLLRGQRALIAKDHQAPDDSKTIAESYRCTDMSRTPVEQWIYLSGWFPTRWQMSGRSESLRSGVAMVGFDWVNEMPWFNFGVGLGFSHTRRRGRSSPLWDGLGDSELYRFDGTSPYVIHENAAYAAVNFSSRGSVCELTTYCGTTTRRILVDAHLVVLPGLHFIDMDDLAPEFRIFRGEANEIVPDIGFFGEAGTGAYLGHNGAIYARFGLGSRRLVDHWRRVDVASTDRRLLWSASVGVTWGLF